MSKLTKVFIASLVLYGILGLALAHAGVLVTEKFWAFVIIMLVVNAIDALAEYKGKLRENIRRGGNGVL